jgi:hypothetical protein
LIRCWPTSQGRRRRLERIPSEPGTIAGRLRVEGRFFVNEAGIFRPRFCSGLSLLRPDRSDADVRAFLDWASGTGFNGLRVFAGRLTWADQSAERARQRLPFLLAEATTRGLYVEVTAITDSKDGGYDLASHVAGLGSIVAGYPNAVIELVNEIGHPTQDDRVTDLNWLASLAAGLPGPVAFGASGDDESISARSGAYETKHLDRGRDKWNMVRRVRELENVSNTLKKPVLNNEPIKAVSQLGDPAIYFTMGALNRGFEVGGVFHFDAGLQGLVPPADQQACADEYVAGSRILGTDDKLTFYNAGWGGSPVKGARFDQTIVRAYSFIGNGQGWTVLLGLSGDPGVEWSGGWRPGAVLADRGAVQVVELRR